MNDKQTINYEENVRNEMYKQFGYTIFLSQTFEKGLVSLLRGMFAMENKGKLPFEKFLEEADKIDRRTLGYLIEKVKTSVPIDSVVENLLHKALTTRNNLIHDYFYENAAKETVLDGQACIVEEMISYQSIFLESFKWIDKLNRELLSKIGYSDETISNIAEKMRLVEVAEFRSTMTREHNQIKL